MSFEESEAVVYGSLDEPLTEFDSMHFSREGDTIYVLVGSYINLQEPGSGIVPYADDIPGVSWDTLGISGYVTEPGTYTVTFWAPNELPPGVIWSESCPGDITLIVVPNVVELEFLSDPVTDGVLAYV